MSNGRRATWSQSYVGDRPRDVLALTEAQEAKLSQFIGFTGRDQSGTEVHTNILRYDGTAAPTVTDFASTPVGTILLCPKLAKPTLYIHKAQSSPAVVGDWYYIEGTQVT